MKPILSFFPGTARPQQAAILGTLEKEWENNDVFIVNAAVGSGKSYLALSIAKWVASRKKTVSILTKDKVLVDQYAREFPSLATLRSSSDYVCVTKGTAKRARTFYDKHWKAHREVDKCEGCQAYFDDLKRAHASKRFPIPLLCNFHVHLAHRFNKQVLIIDEAHNMVPFLQELHTKVWWRPKLQFPKDCWSREDFLKFLRDKKPEGTSELLEELQREKPRSLLVREVSNYFGEPTECVKLVPFDIRGAAPFLWPNRNVKIVFLSGTMNHKDLERVGLEDRRWAHLCPPSPIPPERRPIYVGGGAAMTHTTWKGHIPDLLRFINRIAKVHTHDGQPSRGLVHVTYEISKYLEQFGSDLPFFFHSSSNKRRVLEKWKESTDGILVACGLSEGLDLKDDLARWQIIAKIPWPNLGEPIIREWQSRDEVAYVWETLKQLMQMCGRVCRGPTDFGATYVFDNTVEKLIKQGNRHGLIPEWWKESIIMDERKPSGSEFSRRPEAWKSRRRSIHQEASVETGPVRGEDSRLRWSRRT